MTDKPARARRAREPRLPSFGEAVAEVESILARLEGDDIDVDDLSREVKRAVELIALCRDKLARTETEVRDIVDALQPGAEATGGAGPARGESPPQGTPSDGGLPF